MNRPFKSSAISVALALAFSALAAEPYPALPPTHSTAVTPNIMLYMDTSGSMLQDANNNWMLTGLCNSNASLSAWAACVNNNSDYRALIDSEVSSPNTKMNIAKRVARGLVERNNKLRFGLFSFQDNASNVGDAERATAGILRSGISDMTVAANKAALFSAINALNGRTATPLGEGLLEITRYFEGKRSLYGSGSYTSPIQYRCQKNFVIVLTDGDASGEDQLPGGILSVPNPAAAYGLPVLPYTARDSAGNAVPRNFSVCTAENAAADDDLSVNCPAGLEKADGSFTATKLFSWAKDKGAQDNTYFRALRDVAKYARVADLRVGGFDADTPPGSFDDPKFVKQNLTTYTIGLSLPGTGESVVLPAAAKVGGGRYFTANDETTLTNALNQAINGITASISNAGGVASISDISSVDNWIFQPVFNPGGWYGELRCYKSVDASGVGVGCTPNAKAIIPAFASRRIYTANVSASGSPAQSRTTAFDFKWVEPNIAKFATAELKSLGATETDRKNLVNFLRGQEDIPGFRVRPKDTSGKTLFLGDIIDAQPVVIGPPIGVSEDADYSKFISDNNSRGIVFIGANDGMLHAFNIGTPTASDMGEVMAYVPSAVYPRLAALKDVDYGHSAESPHTHHVNGAAQALDIKTENGWKSLLVGGLGQGGQGYYAIDASDKATLETTAAVKWEWTDVSDPQMGYSFGKPIIYNVRKNATTAQPAVVLSNGYKNGYDDDELTEHTNDVDKITPRNDVPPVKGETSALYVINADTGDLIKRILVPSSKGGLSSPAGVDYGQDGVLDYIYAGDMSGKLWRFDLTDANNFTVAPSPIFDAGATQPISYRPAVMPVDVKDDTGKIVSRRNLVLFGTGKLLTENDRLDVTQQSFYAVIDTLDATPSTVTKSSLLQQSVTDTSDTTERTSKDYRFGNYRRVSANELDANGKSTFDLTLNSETKNGWYMDFAEDSERLVTSPLLIGDKLIFGTGIPLTAEKCQPGGKGWVMGLNPLTGSVVKTSKGKAYSFLDIYLDKKSTERDKIVFSGEAAYASGFQKNGIPTELSYVADSQKIYDPESAGDSGIGAWGVRIAMRNINYMSVYMGNAADGTCKGQSMRVPAASGTVKLFSPSIRQDKADNDNLNSAPTDGYKLQAMTWREIKP